MHGQQKIKIFYEKFCNL